jgi:hypothetical protein
VQPLVKLEEGEINTFFIFFFTLARKIQDARNQLLMREAEEKRKEKGKKKKGK